MQDVLVVQVRNVAVTLPEYAAQKEINLAKARLSSQERALMSVSTGGSAQTVAPQRVFTRPLVPTPELEEPGEDR